MKVITRTLRLATVDAIALIDISADVDRLFQSCGLRDGVLTLMSPHTTAHINLNEREPQLQLDMLDFLMRLVERDGDYRHNRAPVDGRDNAHSHLMGLLMNATESVPFADGKLLLGAWQSVFFVELDGPRAERQVHLQLLGQ
ncbi:secondary thiamine-phosphate synthase enzyme YjbQ [uncultured Thiodictyon sp.]|jgi:secondary thiamine-phosphate synthase enzyme|uniref:secondary thiamine-phosphate synthase enzyme YjbQ n=1 Tax=uncultured Thiodictyon sp. TaxID=1846217 RepID=UPI0025F93F47|nr:secondary thiamine-phosphate synthase enzyme YjbQ [uncultured Thiodictyon sp.]